MTQFEIQKVPNRRRRVGTVFSAVLAIAFASIAYLSAAEKSESRHLRANDVFDTSKPIIFQDNFQSGALKRWNYSENGNYRLPEVTPGRIQVVDAPGLGEGRKAVRFAVERAPNSFRSEISLPSEKGFQERWYAAQMLVPNEWVFDPAEGSDIVLQWHAVPGNFRPTYPNLSISIQNDRWFIKQSFGSPQIKPTRTKQKLDQAVERGEWISWVIHAKWAPDASGILQIWKDGELVIDRKGPNVYGTIGVEYTPYLKTGIYHPEWNLNDERKKAAFEKEKPIATRKIIYVADVKVGAAGASLESFATSAAVAPLRPNVLFIAIDDLNDWLGCYGGHPQAITPNIDRLAEQGILFSNAHCAAPVCKSSRTAVFSGRYPQQTGVFGNNDPDIRKNHPDTVFLTQALADAGYQTAGTGKLLHGSSKGIFEDFFDTEQRWSPFTKKEASYTSEELLSKGSDNPRHLLKRRPGGQGYLFPFNRMPSDRNPDKLDGESFDWASFDLPDSGFGDGQITDWATEKLGESRKRPLFLGVGYYRPHIPLYAPQQDFDQYPPVDKIKLPPILKDDLDDIGDAGKRWAIDAVTAGSHATVVKHEQWQEAVRAYLASVTFIDRQVGKLIAALERSPHADNTLIVLWSDHGWQLGEKQHWGKWNGWRQSTRVPLIIVEPQSNTDAARGEICQQPVSLLDLYPTLLDSCGLPARDDLAGVSLKPLLKNFDRETDRMILSTFDRGNHALSGKRWRYLRYQEGEEELYDIANDPNEWHNLAGTEQHADILKSMRKKLQSKLSVVAD